MKCRCKKRVLAVLMGVLFIALFATVQSFARIDADSPLKILVKIKNVENTMALIDEIAGTSQPGTAMLRGMLQGTRWIDSRRSIVLGVDFSGEMPSATVLIPFSEENESFQTSFNAVVSDDYYLISLPPGNPVNVSPPAEQSLVRASVVNEETALSVELAVADLIADSRDRITGLLGNMEKQLGSQPSDPMAPSPEEIRKLTADGLEILSQVKSLALGVDLSTSELTMIMAAEAKPETRMAKLFANRQRTSHLGRYRPEGHFTYRMNQFNITDMMELFAESFGSFYKKMGLDIAGLSEITKSFTGESVGGITYEKDGMKMEMVHGLNTASAGTDFLDSQYIPWMLDYGNNLSRFFKENAGVDIGQVFTRLPDIAIDGNKVVGIKARFPMSAEMSNSTETNPAPVIIETVFHVAAVGDYLLTAPDQNRMAGLISKVKSGQKEIAEGPLMTAELDMDAYFKYMLELVPEASALASSVPKMGKILMEADIKGGRATSTTRINIDFLKDMLTDGKDGNLSAQPQMAMASTLSGDEKSAEKPGMKQAGAPQKPVKDAAYWNDLGNLVSTYGNDKAAVDYYKKSLALDPQNIPARFNLGISYGQLSRFDEAIEHLDHAIGLSPDNGNYYYGRGRVYLLSGNAEKAMEDFKNAVRFGSRDADEFLKSAEK